MQRSPTDRPPDSDPGQGTSETPTLDDSQPCGPSEVWRTSAISAQHSITVRDNTHPGGETDKMFSSSILENGKLKPGVYKIQNLAGQTYVEMQESKKELCGRPARYRPEKVWYAFGARVFESRLPCLSCDAAMRPDGLDDLSVVGFSTFRARLHHSKGEEKTTARSTNRDLPIDQMNETLGRI